MGAPPMDPLLPDDPRQIGPYRLEARLGVGGMGEVFLARSPGGRAVVVKRIRRHHAAKPEFRDRFAREIEAARRVGGFHTAQVVAADPAADPPWMVTAYIPGPSLHAFVHAHGPLPPGPLRTLGAGLAEGLAAIHACDLVHRDLKPANVILADDGPRIIDFGIARPLDAGTLTETGVLIGTWAYMSPEQVDGRQATVASDVFALGCVLAFAATGRGPFDGPSLPAIVLRITARDPDLSRVPREYGLPEVIASCLAKDPAARPSVDEVLDRLNPPGTDHPWPPPALRQVPAPAPTLREDAAPSPAADRAPSPPPVGDREALQSRADDRDAPPPPALDRDTSPPPGRGREPSPPPAATTRRVAVAPSARVAPASAGAGRIAAVALYLIALPLPFNRSRTVFEDDEGWLFIVSAALGVAVCLVMLILSRRRADLPRRGWARGVDIAGVVQSLALTALYFWAEGVDNNDIEDISIGAYVFALACLVHLWNLFARGAGKKSRSPR